MINTSLKEAIHRLLKERNIRPRLGLRFAHTCYPFEIRPSEEPASADPGINLKSAQGSREMEAAKEESRSSRSCRSSGATDRKRWATVIPKGTAPFLLAIFYSLPPELLKELALNPTS